MTWLACLCHVIVFTHYVVFQEGLVPLQLSQSQDGKAGKSQWCLQLMLFEFFACFTSCNWVFLYLIGWIGDNEQWLREKKMTKFEISWQQQKTYHASAIPPEQQHLNEVLFDLWKYTGVLTDCASDIKYLQFCKFLKIWRNFSAGEGHLWLWCWAGDGGDQHQSGRGWCLQLILHGNVAGDLFATNCWKFLQKFLAMSTAN